MASTSYDDQYTYSGDPLSTATTQRPHHTGACSGFWGCIGHDFHGILNVAGAVSPFATALAIGTSWIPGVDVVTAGFSPAVDGLATIGSGWNVVTDFTNLRWGAFGSLQTYADAGGVLLGSMGFGTSVRSVIRAAEKDAAANALKDLQTQAGRSRSGNPAIREGALAAKSQIPQARARVNSSNLGSAYANRTDQIVNGAGAAEGAGTNLYEDSFNPLTVATQYTWGWDG